MNHGNEDQPPGSANVSRSMKQSLETAKLNRLRDLILECFDIFPGYGRDPEAAGAMLQRFAKVLDHATLQEIEGAFDRWFETKTAMPTPADIVAFIPRKAKAYVEIEDPHGDIWHSGKRWKRVPKQS